MESQNQSNTPNNLIESNMLSHLLDLAKSVMEESDVDRVLVLAVDHLIEISAAERGMIILFDESGDILFQTVRNLNKKDIDHPEFEISRTIIHKVKTTGEAVCLRNACEDPALEMSHSTVRLHILSVICLPLVYNNKSFGVVYLDNRTVRGIFKTETCQFTKHFSDFISLAAYRALQLRQLKVRQQALEKELRGKFIFKNIVGNSPKIMEVLQVVSQVAETDAPILIEGESGTGKELVARAIHYNSRRSQLPLLNINCGALPDNLLESELFGHEKGAFTGAFKRHRGKFEQADGSTIFLDEVDDMSPNLQVKLLRILQWGEFSPLGCEETKRCDVRIVAASKDSLRKLVEKGIFREDLYYRLNLIRIEMPTLRERREDILLLANHFLKNEIKNLSKPVPTLSSEVQTVLQHYDYPGNIRELENIIKRAVILCKGVSIELEHLPVEVLNTNTRSKGGNIPTFLNFQEAKKQAIEKFERDYIQQILQECNGVIRKAAERAGMHEKNFHVKLATYGLRPNK